MNKSPCLNCRYRTIECHNTCESYLQYRKIVDRIKKAKKYDLDATGYIVNNVSKFKKARNLPQYR